MRTRIIAAIGTAIVEAAAVVVPVACAGCGRDDTPLCGACRGMCAARVRHVTVGATRVWFALDYVDEAARIIVAFKNEGRTGLARVLGPAFGASVDAAESVAAGAADDLLVVPIPSRRASMRRRGYRPVGLLARRAGVPLDGRLRFTRQPLDQLGLRRSERRDNLRSALVGGTGLAGRRVIVVDDVLTTGATLLEGIRAVEAAGGVVLGAAVLARTPPGRRSRRCVDGLLGGPSESP